jgi:endonuclease/exonuclease/phosphatase (EEP) superfamily protein YafD
MRNQKKKMRKGELIFAVFGFILIAAALIPLLKEQAWWIRVFDFPRLQLAVTGAGAVLIYIALTRKKGALGYFLILLVSLSVLYQSYRIYPYTPLATKQVKESSSNPKEAVTLSLFISNVLMSNRNIDLYLEIIQNYDPDIIIADETDKWWVEGLKKLEEQYPYSVTYPLGNTYGMSLYSKLKLSSTEILFLVEKYVPSIHTNVVLPSGEHVRLHSLHPEPPHPVKSTDTAERDAELLIVAREAGKSRMPTIVAGDLNDVAWSRTTTLFQKTSGLLDPRIGRGLYNTYHAEYPLFRYPLDHVFHSDHFRIVSLERGPYFGSDHFPIYVKLSYEPEQKGEQKTPERDRESQRETEELIHKRK